MTMSLRSHYAGHRFPPEIISHAIWLYFRFPLSLRMVEEMLAARGIIVIHETVRQWALKYGRAFANQIRCRLPGAGDTNLPRLYLTSGRALPISRRWTHGIFAASAGRHRRSCAD